METMMEERPSIEEAREGIEPVTKEEFLAFRRAATTMEEKCCLISRFYYESSGDLYSAKSICEYAPDGDLEAIWSWLYSAAGYYCEKHGIPVSPMSCDAEGNVTGGPLQEAKLPEEERNG